MSKKGLIVLLILSLFLSERIGAQADSISAFREVIVGSNVASASQNPTKNRFIPFSQLTNLSVGVESEQGGFHPIDQAEKRRGGFVELAGIKRIGKTVFTGAIAYNNQKELERVWNSTLFLSPTNPFVVGDSVQGSYRKEQFVLEGSFTTPIQRSWHFGLATHYRVASSSKDSDPRPESRGMRFNVVPGVSYHTPRWSLGASASYERLSESVAYTVVKTHETHQLFLFRGLGIYTGKQASGFYRSYQGNRWGTATQFTYLGAKNWKCFLELGLEKEVSRATDGRSSSKYKGGKHGLNTYRLMSRFDYKKGGWQQLFSLHAMQREGDGTHFLQKQHVDEDGNSSWELLNAAICQKHTQKEIGLSYQLNLLKQGVPHWIIGASGIYRADQQTSYPNLESQNYRHMEQQLFLKRNQRVGESLVELKAQMGYLHTLSKAIKADRLPLYEVYLSPNFNHLTANFWRLDLEVAYSRKFTIKEKQPRFRWFGRASSTKATTGGLLGGDSRHFFTLGLELII